MRLRPALALAALTAISACGADFFPLQTGNTWTYREARSGQTFTVRVGTPVISNDTVYYSLRGYVDAPRLVRYDDGRNQLLALDEDTGTETVLTDFTPAEGIWWNAPGRLCNAQGQAMEKRAAYQGPAGQVSNVLELRYRTTGCADVGLQGEQYAEHIGMVRRVEDSFAGPRIFELVYAQVGKTLIDATASGRFSISMDQRAGSLAITWRLQTTGELKLVFASGQEYDAVIRDAAGRVVWQWSGDRMFTQAFHDRTVSGEWSNTLNAPVGNLTAGAYTVHVWLTTSGNPSQFAATAPLTIQ